MSACASLPPPAPTVSLERFHIASVEVEGAMTIRSWPVEEEAYIKSRNLDSEAAGKIRTRPISENAELTAHVAGLLKELFLADLKRETGAHLAGPTPAKAVVRLSRFDVPSLARRMFTDQIAVLEATVTLVEPGGAVVVASPALTAALPLLGGLSSPVAAIVETANPSLDPGRTLVSSYAGKYRGWLFPK